MMSGKLRLALRGRAMALGLLLGSVGLSPAQSAADYPAANPPAGVAAPGCDAVVRAGPDLAELVRVALCRHPDARLAWLQTEAQQARLQAARSAWWPEVNLSAGQTHSFGDAGSRDTTSATLGAGWLIFDFGGREASVRQADATLTALHALRDDAAQRVLRTTVDAYYGWFAADATLLAAQAAEAAAQETKRASEGRLKAGTATREDVLQATTAAAQARLAVIQAEGERENALGTLAVAVGLPAGTRLQPVAPDLAAVARTSPPDFPVLHERALAQRTDLRAQAARVEAARATHAGAGAAGRPSLSLSARDGVSSTGGTEAHNGSVGVELNWPLFAGYRYSAQARSAAHELEMAKVTLEKTQQAVSLELHQAWQSVRTAEAVATAADTVVASAEESLRGARARYGAGLGDLVNVLNAQSALADASRQQARAAYDRQRARVALAFATGDLGAGSSAADPRFSPYPPAQMSPSATEQP